MACEYELKRRAMANLIRESGVVRFKEDEEVELQVVKNKH
jgi:hypothetical protein